MNRFFRTTIAVVLLAVMVTACAKDSDRRLTPSAFAGHWASTQWGEHYIMVDGATMKVVYTHDQGRVVGTLTGSTFVGWWTESPSRQPVRDAGEVTFTLTGSGDQRKIDGVWSYGTGSKAENWDLTWVDSTIPDEVAAVFSDASQFKPHP
jgi:hypothetical protein